MFKVICKKEIWSGERVYWAKKKLTRSLCKDEKEKVGEGKEDPDIFVRRQHESTALGRGGVLEKYTRSNIIPVAMIL